MKGERPFTTGDVARYCQVSKVAVLNWIREGKLRAYCTPGGHHRVERQDFRSFLDRYKMPIRQEFPQAKLARVDSDAYLLGF